MSKRKLSKKKRREHMEIVTGMLYHVIALALGIGLLFFGLYSAHTTDTVSIVEEGVAWTYIPQDQLTGLAVAQVDSPSVFTLIGFSDYAQFFALCLSFWALFVVVRRK